MRKFSATMAAAALCTVAGAAAAGSYDSRLSRADPIDPAGTTTARFDRLETLGPDAFDFAEGAAWRIRAEGDRRAVAALRFYVEDGELTVGRDPDSPKNIGTAKVHITAPALREAGHAGSGSLLVDALAGERAEAQLAGSGRLEVRAVSAQSLNASVAGSGRLTIVGRSDSARFAIAGSGRLDGARFATGSANASIAGSGDTAFRASGAVRANIVGSGDVIVTGTTDCRATRIGSGRLRCSG